MFMFRRKRNNLIRRLLKARIRRDGCEYETGSEIEDGGSTRVYASHHQPAMDVTNGNMGGGGGGDCETLVRSTLLKKLEDTQLELLTGAVESRGADLSDCVLLSRKDVAAMGQQAHVLCCQMWRWPELRQAAELKRLPVCESANDTVYICCNPYHWSRLCEPESPPPPYSRFAMDQLKPEDRAPSEIPLLCGNRYPGSLTTSGEGSSIGSGEWCKLAYWELTQRVGNQFPVRVPSITVFENDPRGNGLCLATLQHNFTPPDSVRRTRAKIGHGVILSQEVDGVWAYNISDAPIFVNSPTLVDTGSRPLVVYRVPSGHCLCIHDPERAANRNYGWHFTEPTGPIDPNSIRISFVKGWGPNYSRQEITACPCWLEVLLAPCR